MCDSLLLHAFRQQPKPAGIFLRLVHRTFNKHKTTQANVSST